MHEGLRGPLEREAADQVHEARLAQKADTVYGAQMQPEDAEKYHGRVGGARLWLSVHKDRERGSVRGGSGTHGKRRLS